MMPYLTDVYGNPSSGHGFGQDAARGIENAREAIASLIGARSAQEIIFTSGATESDSLAILGVADRATDRRHLVTVTTEHKAVLEPCRLLARRGFELSVLRVDRSGMLDLDEFESTVRCDTLLVSVMAANNEVGTLAPLREISMICHRAGALFHTDAAQLVGKRPLDVEDLALDLMSVSGHKMYGPKGVGALYVRRKAFAAVAPLQLGGGQERGLRSGTLNVPGCVGLGAAAALAASALRATDNRLEALRALFLQSLQEEVPDIEVNGHPQFRLPGTINLRFPGVDADSLQWSLPEVAISSGSACTQGASEPSHVLRAMGLSYDQARECVRIGIGRTTTERDIEYAVSRIAQAVGLVREHALLTGVVR